MFDDRNDAARKLAVRLERCKGRNPLVLGIPRGAVPMACLVADALQGEVDVVLVRKLHAPGNPEFAVGAVEESGWTFIAPHATSVGADRVYLEREKQTQLELIRQRRAQYTAHRPRIDPTGRLVIVIDDGLATGSTMIAALHAIREQRPAWLICAVPVSPPDTLDAVSKYADETVCLETPSNFNAVGQFYREFHQVEDADVTTALARQGRTAMARDGDAGSNAGAA
jgi:predicted phosphoribosyltransferase